MFPGSFPFVQRRRGGWQEALRAGFENAIKPWRRPGSAPARATGRACAPCPGTPRRRCRNADIGDAHRSLARSPPAKPCPLVDPTEPQQPCGTALPSVHRFTKTSPETAPDPLFRSPWPMQVETQCSTYACEIRTEPDVLIVEDNLGGRNHATGRRRSMAAGRFGSDSSTTDLARRATTFPLATTRSRSVLSRMASTGSKASRTTKLARLPGSSP